jgi:hypothetical protein
LDPLVEFLETAAKREGHSPGGFLNFFAMGLLALGVIGTGTKWILGQTFGLLFSLADLLRYTIDRVLAALAAKAGNPIEAVKPPKQYKVPTIPPPRLAYVVVLGTLLLACPLALAFAHPGAAENHQSAHNRDQGGGRSGH